MTLHPLELSEHLYEDVTVFTLSIWNMGKGSEMLFAVLRPPLITQAHTQVDLTGKPPCTSQHIWEFMAAIFFFFSLGQKREYNFQKYR